MLQLTAGRGPAECCWVVAKVLNVLLEEARQQGLEATVLSRTKGQENGTLQSALVRIVAEDASSFLASWTGTVQWVGQSKFRKFHKRKNWFIAVCLIDGEHTVAAVREQDIRYDLMLALPGTPGSRRFDELVVLIEEYEARRDGYDLARMRRILSGSG